MLKYTHCVVHTPARNLNKKITAQTTATVVIVNLRRDDSVLYIIFEILRTYIQVKFTWLICVCVFVYANTDLPPRETRLQDYKLITKNYRHLGLKKEPNEVRKLVRITGDRILSGTKQIRRHTV